MELDLIRIFVKVVQNGSFSKAAGILRMPNSTVSKAVAKLERSTGTKLLLRTTRSLTLTQAGRAFYDAAIGPVLQLEDAQKSLSGHDSILHGQVKITAPEDLGYYLVAPALAELSKQHKDLSFDIEFKNDIVDLIKEGFDLAIRLGKIRDSGLKSKYIDDIHLITVASPQYLRNFEKIKQPADFKNHACLSLNYEGTAKHWTLRSDKGTSRVEIKPKIIANQMTGLLQLALNGAGVAFVPSYICRSYLDSGALVRVLPSWSSVGFPVSIVTPLAPSSAVRLKVTVDHLVTALKGVLGQST